MGPTSNDFRKLYTRSYDIMRRLYAKSYQKTTKDKDKLISAALTLSWQCSIAIVNATTGLEDCS